MVELLLLSRPQFAITTELHAYERRGKSGRLNTVHMKNMY